jgi:hypothetical protein
MPSKKAQKEWYQRHKDHMRQKQRDRRAELKRWFAEEVLAGKTCTRCPEADMNCFDFHHTDPSLKEFNIAEAIMRKMSKERILTELVKCEILCSNCHRKHHASK